MTTAQMAQFVGAGQPFEHRRARIPAPGAGEVVVRIDLCTICGSDLHTILGRRSGPVPSVLGHEIVGRVEALPPDPVTDVLGEPLRIHDRVTWTIHASCGDCFYCQHGLRQKCSQLFKYGHEASTDRYPSTGGFASHCQLRRETGVIRVPESLPDEVASPLNCATATVMAAFREAGSCRDQCVFILGAGMLGLTAAAVASYMGAAQVVVMEPQATRREQARQFGATHTVGRLPEARDMLNELTEGRGADLSFDFSGKNDAVLAAIHFLRIGGRAVLVGSVSPTESIAVSPELLVRRWLRISGVHNYGAEDLQAAVAFQVAAHERFPFTQLVAACYDLSDLQAAVEHASQGDAIRIGIRCRD